MSQFTIPKDRQGPPLSEYKEEDEIGKGGFGKVCTYKRRSRLFGSQKKSLPAKMAVKTVLLSRSTSTGREVDITLSVDHENIIQILGVSVKGDSLHIKMELANTDLSRLKMKMNLDKFAIEDVLIFGRQILNGLAYLHEKGISHRDLKPHNVLVLWKADYDFVIPKTSSITLKLTDFGLSRNVLEVSATVTAVGTRGYMAPEVAKAHKNQEKFHGDYKKADVFSVGVIFYELLHGEKPFSEEDLTSELEASITHDHITSAPAEQWLAISLQKMLKWSYRDRCDVKRAKRGFGPKASPVLLQSVDMYGRTELHKEALTGNCDNVEWLIDSGANVNGTDNYGRTPLHFACSNGHQSTAQMLLANGADVNTAECDGMTSLHQASKDGDISMTKLLIERGADVNNIDRKRDTPLYQACLYGHFSVAKLLVECGADANRVDMDGFCPLHYVCKEGDISISKWLLESAADVNKVDRNGNTSLFHACANDHVEVVRLLVESKAEVNTVQGDGRTALHSACRGGFLAVAKLLIEKDADVNATDARGVKPVKEALDAGHNEIAALLLRNGASNN